MPNDPASAVEAVYRADWGKIVATLIKLIGDFDIAEECAQEAFAAAADQWRDWRGAPLTVLGTVSGHAALHQLQIVSGAGYPRIRSIATTCPLW